MLNLIILHKNEDFMKKEIFKFKIQEVDFILGDKEVALEIKSGKMVHGIELKSLKALQEDGQTKHSVVVCCEKYPREVGNISVIPWTIFLEKLWAGDFGV